MAPTTAAAAAFLALNASSFHVSSALSVFGPQHHQHQHQHRGADRFELSSTATAFETATGTGTGAANNANSNVVDNNGDEDSYYNINIDHDYIASALLEPPPSLNFFPEAVTDEDDYYLPEWNNHKVKDDYWHHDHDDEVSTEGRQYPITTASSSPSPIGMNNERDDHDHRYNKRSNNNRPRPIRSVVTGRDRRAAWDSYAPARGATERHRGGASGGVIGSPGGVGDWHYASGYGPAITSTSSSGSTFEPVVPSIFSGALPSKATATANKHKSFNNYYLSKDGDADAGSRLAKKQKQHTVMTGSERRSGFDSFSPISPPHEVTRNGSGRRSIAGSPAETVAATLSALPTSSSYNNDNDKSTAGKTSYHHRSDNNNIMGTTTEETITDAVPMDTPARRSLPPHLSLRLVPGKGLGVFANVPISSGEFVGEYRGEIMSREVKDRRYMSSSSSSSSLQEDTLTREDREWIKSRLNRGQTLTGCYLYGVDLPSDINDDDDDRTQLSRSQSKPRRNNRIYVDAEDEYESSWTRFVNHGSTPLKNNVDPKSDYCYDNNDNDNGNNGEDNKLQVWFVANRDIDAGEEICFDYGDGYWLEGDEVV